MAPTLAEILREHWPSYTRANRAHLSAAHYRAARSALACRTPELGGRLYQCGGCKKAHFAYHSCNHRSCPQCGALDQQLWSAKQESKLLPVPHFLVTYTIPAELRSACLRYPKELYATILRESAAALADVTATKTKGGRTGCTSVLHTWGRQMQHHPHVHSIVPAIALDIKKERLIHPKKDSFLIHYRPLAARFRNRVKTALQTNHPEIYKKLTPGARATFHPSKNWNVQLQPAGRGATAVRYLARYVQRSAFTPKRLTGTDKTGDLMLRWTSSQTGKTGVLHLSPHEFIRRWLLHVLPKGFPRIRHYGWLAGAATKTRLKIRLLLGQLGEPIPDRPEVTPFTCPGCGGELTFTAEVKRSYNAAPRGPPRNL